ncbi:MAG TPA: TfuA-like protein [Jatrophihabitans sp.]|nr:TfuA-like protein [Jatrophihabitans sp.]
MYVGPTLAAQRVAAELPGAIIHPPIEHGDLMRVPWSADDVVVIVDGYYHQTGAVRHKEVLQLLADRVTVIGCASMGALRAAELHTLGMIGNGVVFGMYRDGVIDGDDEVAVAHGEEPDYRRFGEPLVNVRHAVSAAHEAQVLSADEADRVIAAARSIPYTARSWRAIEHTYAATDESAADTFDRLRAFLASHPDDADIKAADAIDTLSRLDEIINPARGRGVEWSLSKGWRSHSLYGWRAAFTGTAVQDVHVSHGEVLRYCQLYRADFPDRWQRFALAQIEKSQSAQAGGAAEHDPTAGALDAAARHGVAADTVRPRHLRTWLTSREAADLPRRDALVRMLVRSYRPPRKDYDLMTEWSSLTADPTTRAAVAECHQVNAEVASWEAGQTVNHLRYSTLRDHLVSTWQLADEDDETLLAAARDRGFSMIEDAVAAARLYFLRNHFLVADSTVTSAEAS